MKTKTIVSITTPKPTSRVYEPSCNNGYLLYQCAKCVQSQYGNRIDAALYGQKANSYWWKAAKSNLGCSGIEADFGPTQADVFFNDLHDCLKADVIVSATPSNMSDWGRDKLINDLRWKYGIPPVQKRKLRMDSTCRPSPRPKRHRMHNGVKRGVALHGRGR